MPQPVTPNVTPSSTSSSGWIAEWICKLFMTSSNARSQTQISAALFSKCHDLRRAEQARFSALGRQRRR
jgi:hypothetical protein